jgi:hypothetical protein
MEPLLFLIGFFFCFFSFPNLQEKQRHLQQTRLGLVTNLFYNTTRIKYKKKERMKERKKERKKETNKQTNKTQKHTGAFSAVPGLDPSSPPDSKDWELSPMWESLSFETTFTSPSWLPPASVKTHIIMKKTFFFHHLLQLTQFHA